MYPFGHEPVGKMQINDYFLPGSSSFSLLAL